MHSYMADFISLLFSLGQIPPVNQCYFYEHYLPMIITFLMLKPALCVCVCVPVLLFASASHSISRWVPYRSSVGISKEFCFAFAVHRQGIHYVSPIHRRAKRNYILIGWIAITKLAIVLLDFENKLKSLCSYKVQSPSATLPHPVIMKLTLLTIM